MIVGDQHCGLEWFGRHHPGRSQSLDERDGGGAGSKRSDRRSALAFCAVSSVATFVATAANIEWVVSPPCKLREPARAPAGTIAAQHHWPRWKPARLLAVFVKTTTGVIGPVGQVTSIERVDAVIARAAHGRRHRSPISRRRYRESCVPPRRARDSRQGLDGSG